MSRTIKDNLNKRGRIRKTIDIEPDIFRKANAVLKKDKRRRTFRRFVEDLMDAEYDRVLGRAA